MIDSEKSNFSLEISDAAADELHNLVSDASEGSGLRLSIDRGGCAGLQYQMKIDQPSAEDFIIEHQGARVIVDRQSAEHLSGSLIDFSDDLSDSGFKIKNPNASRSCGCGTSFEPATASAH